jgi:hypothetical protein
VTAAAQWQVALLAPIALGTAGLILGPVAMLARKVPGLHTKAGEAYHWVMLGVCGSAGALAVLDWGRIWWFLPVAVGSYAFALTSRGRAAPTSPCRPRS